MINRNKLLAFSVLVGVGSLCAVIANAQSIGGYNGPSIYTGPIANVSYIGIVGSGGTAAGSTNVQGRVPIIFTDDLVNATVQVCLANWGLYNNVVYSFQELAIPGTATANAAIEYPAGTMTQSTQGSAGSISIATGTTGCVQIPGVTAPNGARAWIRMWQTNATGNVPVMPFQLLDALHGGVSNLFNATNTNGTFLTSATVTQESGNGTPYTSFLPLMVLGPTSKPTFALVGDSNCTGNYEGVPVDNTGYRGPVGRIVTGYGLISTCASGEAAQYAKSNFTKRAAMVAQSGATMSINNYVLNDLANSQTAAQTIASNTTIAGLLPATMRNYITTGGPKTTSTCNWLNPACQTVSASPATFHAQWVLYNDSIRSSPPSGYSTTLDLTAGVDACYNCGLWLPGMVYLPDTNGVHYSDFGSLTAAAAVQTVFGNALLHPQALGVSTNPTAKPPQFGFPLQAVNSIQMTQLSGTPTCSVLVPLNQTGTTTYTYEVVAKDINNNPATASTACSTAVGNATLSGTTGNYITWPPVYGAYSYDVYRTVSGGTPSTTGQIGNTVASYVQGSGAQGNYSPGSGTTYPDTLWNVYFQDTGIAASGAYAAPVNQTGTIQAFGYRTNTYCVSSSGACGSAAAGAVSVAAGTNSTVTVSTSAVTTNSQILLSVDETRSTVLSVTCNTTAANVAIPPVVTTRTPGVSFVITIPGTTATNPVCVNYSIIN